MQVTGSEWKRCTIGAVTLVLASLGASRGEPLRIAPEGSPMQSAFARFSLGCMDAAGPGCATAPKRAPIAWLPAFAPGKSRARCLIATLATLLSACTGALAEPLAGAPEGSPARFEHEFFVKDCSGAFIDEDVSAIIDHAYISRHSHFTEGGPVHASGFGQVRMTIGVRDAVVAGGPCKCTNPDPWFFPGGYCGNCGREINIWFVQPDGALTRSNVNLCARDAFPGTHGGRPALILRTNGGCADLGAPSGVDPCFFAVEDDGTELHHTGRSVDLVTWFPPTDRLPSENKR